METKLSLETEREADGRWLARASELPGVTLYGQTCEEASVRAQAWTLRVLADRLEHGEPIPEVTDALLVTL